MPELIQWNNFYVIVGSAAGALIGLQFVVVTLIGRMPASTANVQAGAAAFSTPSVVHFAVVLLISAVSAAPWRATSGIAVFWAVIGLTGIIYSLMVAQRMRHQKAYRPVFEDWAFHVLLPLAAYAVLVATVVVVSLNTHALFMPASSVLLLLFSGIHNAWDAATYHIFANTRQAQDADQKTDN